MRLPASLQGPVLKLKNLPASPNHPAAITLLVLGLGLATALTIQLHAAEKLSGNKPQAIPSAKPGEEPSKKPVDKAPLSENPQAAAAQKAFTAFT